MKILFLSHYFYPHIGGVEKHAYEVAKSLVKRGHKVTVVTEKYISNLKNSETTLGVKVIRFSYPHSRFFGLLKIWGWLFKNHNLIKDADVVHCHDVFVWYLPFKLLFPKKKVYTTFHGWEGTYPIPKKNIFLKQIAEKLSNKTIAVGKYIEKYYKIKADQIIYGGSMTKDKSSRSKFEKNSFVFVGRLQEDTGVLQFLKYIDEKRKNTKLRVDFVGDGDLRKKCEEYGDVHGLVDPTIFLQNAEYCVPGGYLSYIEAVGFGCKIKTFTNNNLKKDYWNEISKVKSFPTWDEVTIKYLELWRNE